jgi:hypothetical protein
MLNTIFCYYFPVWCKASGVVATVARSQTGMSANLGKKFVQIRKNSAVCQKYVFTATKNKISIKMYCPEIYIRKSSDHNCLQKPINHGKIHSFHTIFCRPVFGRFCPKSSAVRPPNFPGQSFFYSAGFVLFCRIFGRLATVVVAFFGLLVCNILFNYPIIWYYSINPL